MTYEDYYFLGRGVVWYGSQLPISWWNLLLLSSGSAKMLVTGCKTI
jgi:hypothetical protein